MALCGFSTLQLQFQNHSNISLTYNRKISTPAIDTARPASLIRYYVLRLLACPEPFCKNAPHSMATCHSPTSTPFPDTSNSSLMLQLIRILLHYVSQRIFSSSCRFFSGCLWMEQFIITPENYIKKKPTKQNREKTVHWEYQHVFFHCLYLGTVS